MNNPKDKKRRVLWEDVEDPDFSEHLRRIFEIIMKPEPEIQERNAEDRMFKERAADSQDE